MTATLIPFCLILLFGTVFGSISDVGDYDYIDFIVPGIILQSIAQASQYSAMNVTADMTKGHHRPFSLYVSFKICCADWTYRCRSDTRDHFKRHHCGNGSYSWLQTTCGACRLAFVYSALVLINITFTLIAVLCGTISKTVEGATGLLFPLFILPFMSSGFAPVDTLPSGIGWFAAIQPMTPMIDSLRALTLDLPLGNRLWLTLAWCIALGIVSFAVSMRTYNRK